MAKKQEVISMPTECCGVCTYSHNMERSLVCFVDPPKVILEPDGVESVARGCEVFPQDPICRHFKPRMHS